MKREKGRETTAGSGNRDLFGKQITLAINDASSTCAATVTASDSASREITLTQDTAGAVANGGLITGTVLTVPSTPVMTKTNFVGGVSAVSAAGTHALHFFDDRASTTIGGGTVITDDAGILFDPAGPAVMYHQDFEGISRGTRTYLTIKPTSWASGKALNWTLAGALADDTSIGFAGITGTTKTTAMTDESGSAASAATPDTILESGSIDHAAANADGFTVTWLVASPSGNRLPAIGTLDDDGSVLTAGAAGEVGLGFALSWNVSSGSAADS